MKEYRSTKGIGTYYILGLTILWNFILMIIYHFINSYELSNLLKLALIVFNLYQLYYIVICSTLKYSMGSDSVCIKTLFGIKKELLPFKDIYAYQKTEGYVKGMKLSGYGKNSFDIGRSFVNDIGTTYMFATSTKNVIYLNTSKGNYGISPDEFHEFEKELMENKIKNSKWQVYEEKCIDIRKNKKFFWIFMITAILSLVITITPIIMYLFNSIPARMPLDFNPDFTPYRFGTGKQFAFKQMTYGLLNMAILFCMYYAGFLLSKYDKKSSYKYIYISFILTLVFFIMQIRIITNFR